MAELPRFPTSRAINVSTDPNNVRCVVGGPLSTSGLPFGHSVICGDKSGHITLRNVISGIERKQIATSYHGHVTSGGGSCAGGLPTCGEHRAVTFAEVIPDNGSPNLWIGCSDGSVQIYFLGGNINHNHQSSSSASRGGRAGGVRSPARYHHEAGGRASSSAAASVAAPPTSALGDDVAEMQAQEAATAAAHQHNNVNAKCTHCGSSTPVRRSSPPSSRAGVSSPPSNRNLFGGSARRTTPTATTTTTTPVRATTTTTTSLGGGGGGGSIFSPSPARGSPSSIGAGGSSSMKRSSVMIDSANTITQEGCILIFAEKKHSGAIQACVSAPSIDSVFTGGVDWHIVRWRASAPFGVMNVIGQHTRAVRSLAFSPGNPCIVLSGGDDGVIKLWSSRQRKATDLTGHRGSVLCVAPWYDTMGLYGDVVTAAMGPVVASSPTATASQQQQFYSSAASENNASASASSPTSHQQQNINQQPQRAIGLVSCGEDGTLRLWAADAQIANTVVHVASRAPVVNIEIFSDNLILACSKDGSVSVYNVPNFPDSAHCIYRFDNVGQVHRILHSNKQSMSSSSSSSSARGRLSSYLHDVKVLAHINGFLIWSLTSQGAKLSMLPLRHFEHTTKKQLATISERREVIEALIGETLDDADSTQSGQLLFQRIMGGGSTTADVESLLSGVGGGGGGGGAAGMLLQLAKQAQQSQAGGGEHAAFSGGADGSNPAAGGSKQQGWHFDPSEVDLDVDPGQLSSTEMSASTFRSIARSVQTCMFELERLFGEFHGRKLELQITSFQKVMDKTRTASHDFLKREFDVLESRRREILAAEKEMNESETQSNKNSTSPSANIGNKPKVNPRVQIASMLQEMLQGKRTPMQTRSSLFSSSSSAPGTSSSSASSSSSAPATFGDEEKKLIDGISKSVTGEGAASYIYSYVAAKQQQQQQTAAAAAAAASQQQQQRHHQPSASSRSTSIVVASEDKTTTATTPKKNVFSTTRTTTPTSPQSASNTSTSSDSVDAAMRKQLEEAVADLKQQLVTAKKAHRDAVDAASAAAALHKKELAEEKKKRAPPPPEKLARLDDADRADREHHQTGSMAFKGGDLSSLSSAALVITADKRLKRALKHKDQDKKHQSDEDDIASKKEAVADEVVVTLPGVGSWGGTERRSQATQTKILTRASTSSQVSILSGGDGASSANGAAAWGVTSAVGLRPGEMASPSWSDQERELLRESAKFLTSVHASQQSGYDDITAGAADHDILLTADREDPSLLEVSKTVEAAMAQLSELEKVYAVSKNNLIDFEAAALASGLQLDDPRLRRELRKLQGEERGIAEEMRRLHYLLVSPNSAIPSPSRKFVDSMPNELSPMNRLKTEQEGDVSLLREFKTLIGKEKGRLVSEAANSPSVSSQERRQQQPYSSYNSPAQRGL